MVHACLPVEQIEAKVGTLKSPHNQRRLILPFETEASASEPLPLSTSARGRLR